MTNDEQPRDNIGKYGFKPQSTPEVELAETVDGSFLFPPSNWPGGAAQYLDFWRTQPISDEALTNFASAYAAERDDWQRSEAAPAIAKIMETWGNSFEALEAKKKGLDVLQQARDAYGASVAAKWDAGYPPRIPNSVVRHVARAAQMMDNLDRLDDPAEREQVRSAVVYMNQDNLPLTVQELWNRWRLGAIMPDAFYARENEVSRKLRELTDRLVGGSN